MLEYLRGLFNFGKIDPEIMMRTGELVAEELLEAQREHIKSLRSENEFLRDQIKMIQEKLFIAVRLTVRQGAENEAQRRSGVENRGEASSMKESTVTKSWPRLKQELEKAHLRKPDDDKLKYWQGVNARLEAEIPGMNAGLNSENQSQGQLNLDLQELER